MQNVRPEQTMACLGCGRPVKTHTQVCQPCRRVRGITDIEMWSAKASQVWLSRIWQ